MDSGGSISISNKRMMPFLAILSYELRSLWTSWLVRIWLICSALFALLTIASGWGSLQSAILIASMLFPFLVFPWFLIVMILGISPVTGGRLDALADGILSRPITRYEYLLACWGARVITALGVFLLVVTPCVAIVGFAQRPVADDSVTIYGSIAALALVSLVLTFLVSLGFLAGALLRRPLVSAVILILVWFPVNLILHTFSLEEFSPISLNQALPTLLRMPWQSLEEGDQRLSEEDAAALARQAAQFFGALSGSSGNQSSESRDFYERGNYEDFSLWRVVLGYGVLTLAAAGVATLSFCWRDL